MNNKVYLLSTGRTGTSFISNLIEKKFNTSSTLHQHKGSRILNIISNISLKYGFVKKALIKYIDNKNDSFPPTTIDPLQTMALSIYLNELNKKDNIESQPITIIHLVRDPRDFVTSFMNWKERKLSGKIAHYLIPFWMPKPPSENIFKNLTMNKFEHFCWVWQIKNNFIYENFSACQNYYLYRFEDVMSDPKVLSELIMHIVGDNIILNESYLNDKINKSYDNKFPKWHEWSKKKACNLENICGSLMKEFEYGYEIDWKRKLEKK
jgi:hypothetical protein